MKNKVWKAMLAMLCMVMILPFSINKVQAFEEEITLPSGGGNAIGNNNSTGNTGNGGNTGTTGGNWSQFAQGITPQAPGDGKLNSSVNKILGVAQWIGFIVGVVMVIWIGVKYITAGANGKAEVKATMVPWLVGAACVALAPTIAAAAFGIFDS